MAATSAATIFARFVYRLGPVSYTHMKVFQLHHRAPFLTINNLHMRQEVIQIAPIPDKATKQMQEIIEELCLSNGLMSPEPPMFVGTPRERSIYDIIWNSPVELPDPPDIMR